MSNLRQFFPDRGRHVTDPRDLSQAIVYYSNLYLNVDSTSYDSSTANFWSKFNTSGLGVSGNITTTDTWASVSVSGRGYVGSILSCVSDSGSATTSLEVTVDGGTAYTFSFGQSGGRMVLGFTDGVTFNAAADDILYDDGGGGGVTLRPAQDQINMGPVLRFESSVQVRSKISGGYQSDYRRYFGFTYQLDQGS